MTAFRIEEMDCASEVNILRRALTPLVGSPDRLEFDVLSRRMRVDLAGLDLHADDVVAAVARTGMRAAPEAAGHGGAMLRPAPPAGQAHSHAHDHAHDHDHPHCQDGCQAEGQADAHDHAPGIAPRPAQIPALAGCSCCGGACAVPAPGGASGGFASLLPRGLADLWRRQSSLLLCALSGVALVAGIGVEWAHTGSLLDVFSEAGVPHPATLALWLAAAVAGAWRVLPRAVHAVRTLRPDMNLLMVTAVIGAAAIGQFFEGASVAFLFAVANQLESWSVDRARSAIAALLDISPSRALLLSRPGDMGGDIGGDGGGGLPGAPVETAVENVPVGSRILVRAGDRVPLDGTVAAGASDIDQSPITGESMPVPKRPGEPVYAGTINGGGVLEVLTTRAASDTTLARILHMVEAAQSRRARAVQWVDRFAAVYTPAMLAVAALVAVAPPLFFGGAWSAWVYEALVVLVIACPCALVISTPVSIVAGLTSAARNGVLVKGGSFLELPASLTAIAFDKTGTLTHGRPRVARVLPVAGHPQVRDEASALRIAAALEGPSSHPLARAIVQHAHETLGAGPDAAATAGDHRTLPGLGAEGVVDGARWRIGNRRFFAQDGPSGAAGGAELPAGTGGADAGSSVLLWNDAGLAAVMELEDDLRPDARAVLDDLRAAGLRRVVMLTGDNAASAARVAAACGVTAADDVKADLLPADKTAAVAALVEAGERVAMVGDGVNDAPALATAHLGIAMGGIGSDAAIETADITLMSDDLGKLPWLVRHSRRTLGVIRQNIGFALGLKALFLGLAVFQVASLWMAIVADIGGSFLVIMNGLRLLRPKA
ncbi:heavy metal translocating P-type ATPase [Nitratidesulfovibrio sp. 1201_IL3209]|uniref:heavy metal translocating P-type ATPase n=1 Tax=Nitratidesulfovibrio sp. 1201_IL3209 TaxID=3084053 RepID=UPI002FD8AEE4